MSQTLKSSGIKTGRRKLGRIYAQLVQRRLGRVQNNMAAKKSMKESRGRKWSEDELKEFASVLADDRTEFVTKICISKSCLSWRRREIDFKSCNAAAMLEFEQFVRISRA